MGVFDGGTYQVNVYWKGEDPDEPESIVMDDTKEFVDGLRGGSDVKAVEVFNLHYVVGNYREDLSFGNPHEDEEDE
ncbi:hypothetical protein AB0D68_11165 [Streptomyces sp. NPDC048212]|uniref:hypothetical protein n=1 Tax=Streptomyces sp. NPDC048212 TaxID=3156658 RepID=UPI0033C65A47